MPKERRKELGVISINGLKILARRTLSLYEETGNPEFLVAFIKDIIKRKITK